jgi:hypothetical protein
MRREVISAVVSAGVAGFFWGAVLYEVIGGSWGRVRIALFCACALSFGAYQQARKI